MKQRRFLCPKMVVAYCPDMDLRLPAGEGYYGLMPGAGLARPLTIVFSYAPADRLLMILRIYFGYPHDAVAGIPQFRAADMAPLSELLRQQIAASCQEGQRTMAPVAAPLFYLRFGTGISAYQRRVLECIQRIPLGSTATYGQIATQAGSPRAYRRVGTICATNALPLLIPCHRVVPAAYGSAHHRLATTEEGIGSYQGGSALKAQLLAQEYTCSRRH